MSTDEEKHRIYVGERTTDEGKHVLSKEKRVLSQNLTYRECGAVVEQWIVILKVVGSNLGGAALDIDSFAGS